MTGDADAADRLREKISQAEELQGLMKAANAAIRKHGGEVIFVQTPTAGKLRELEDKAYPREVYWDRLSTIVGADPIPSHGNRSRRRARRARRDRARRASTR